MTVVSASNGTDTTDMDSTYSTVSEDTDQQTSELITKKTDDNVVKTSSNKASSKISTDSQTITYNNTVKLSAKVTNANNGDSVTGGKVAFKINGNTVGISSVNNGLATLVYDSTNLKPKTYTITAKYGETSTLLGSTATASLTVKKDSSYITVSDAEVVSKSTVTLKATIVNSRNNPVTDGKVAFNINGKSVAVVNATNGIATYSYTASSLSAKTYRLTAIYGGNKLYESSRSQTAELIVTAIPTKITMNRASGYSTKILLKATVVDKTRNSYLTSGTVIFKVNDKTVGSGSISNGKASFIYDASKLARGKYKISAHLKATSTYASSSVTSDMTVLAESHFTYSQIKTAAVAVRTQLEANNNVLTVYIGKSRIGLSDFLALMIQSTKNVYNGKPSATVAYKQYKTLTTQTDSMNEGVLTLSQVMAVGDNVLSYMKKNNVPPKYVATSLGKMGYYNIVYSYSKVLDVSSSDYLPLTCRVYNWAKIHPSNPKTRKIYITSDHIYNTLTDYKFMNSIKSALKSKRYTVEIWHYGPNSHNTAIWSEELPDNAVQLSIFGGADAGVIYDVCTRSFMRLKANRLLFFAYHSGTSKDITGLSFLKRAKDDNYSSDSFTGIANPDSYLRNHGYDYVYTSNVNTIVNSLIKYIS